MSAVLTRSGGIVYHLRASQHRRHLWQPFRRVVAQWLADWNPPTPQLVVIGPSGGYTLPGAFLRRFADLVFIEPDPVARWMLKQRFATLSFRFAELDCFADIAGPSRLAREFPDAAVLFSNVIGQLLEDLPNGWRGALLAALRDRHWASYHDVVSSARPPERNAAFDAAPDATLESVLMHFWGGGELELHDHRTFALTGQAAHYMTWALTPRRHHLIEWQAHAPA